MASELALALRRAAAIERINKAAGGDDSGGTVISDPSRAKDRGIGMCVMLEQVADLMEHAYSRGGGADQQRRGARGKGDAAEPASD